VTSCAGCGVAGGAAEQLVTVNLTPVTVSAATSTPQTLQSGSFAGGALSPIGKTFRLKSSGTYSIASGGVGTTAVDLILELNTVQTPAIANFIGTQNGPYKWTIDANCSTSASTTVLCSGTESFGFFSDNSETNNTVTPFFTSISGVNLSLGETLTVQIQFSASSASNTATGSYLTLEQLN
jgi:hypothetical protein